MKNLLIAAIMACTINSVSAESCCSMTKAFDREVFTREFAEGFVAGAVATVGVDFFREYLLPDISQLNLYSKYGICRDRFAGEVTVALATLGIAARHDLKGRDLSYKVSALGARLLGVIVGSAVAKVAQKKISYSLYR